MSLKSEILVESGMLRPSGPLTGACISGESLYQTDVRARGDARQRRDDGGGILL